MGPWEESYGISAMTVPEVLRYAINRGSPLKLNLPKPETLQSTVCIELKNTLQLTEEYVLNILQKIMNKDVLLDTLLPIKICQPGNRRTSAPVYITIHKAYLNKDLYVLLRICGLLTKNISYKNFEKIYKML